MKNRTIGNIFKRTAAGIFIVLCASIMICGCNPEAFVSHIGPSSRDFIAPEEGGTIKVHFKADDWRVSTIKTNGVVYDWTGSSSIIETTDDGMIKVSGDNFTMFYKKTGNKELTLVLQPNFSDTENDITIFISNNYEEDSVLVRQPASSGYEFVDISYDGLICLTNEGEVITGWGPMTFINNGADTLFISKGVFAGAARSVSFTNDSNLGYQGNDFEVPVPDGALFEDKSLTFSGAKVAYSCTTTFEYPYESDKMANMSFPPASTEKLYYRMLWGIDSYEVDYNLRIRNKKTGSIFTINGKMRSTSPDGFYLLTKERR